MKATAIVGWSIEPMCSCCKLVATTRQKELGQKRRANMGTHDKVSFQ